MIEAFRMRGIHPGGVTSLAEESLLWPSPDGLPPMGTAIVNLLPDLFFQAIQSFDTSGWRSPVDLPPRSSPSREQYRTTDDEDGEEYRLELNTELATQLAKYARDNAETLGLDPDAPTQVRGFHPVFRVAPNGQLLIELVAQFAQQDRSTRKDLGGIPFRGGATAIASANGTVRYLITKPFHRGARGSTGERARARLERQRGFVASADMMNPKTPYMSREEHAVRIAALASFSSLHGGGRSWPPASGRTRPRPAAGEPPRRPETPGRARTAASPSACTTWASATRSS